MNEENNKENSESEEKLVEGVSSAKDTDPAVRASKKLVEDVSSAKHADPAVRASKKLVEDVSSAEDADPAIRASKKLVEDVSGAKDADPAIRASKKLVEEVSSAKDADPAVRASKRKRNGTYYNKRPQKELDAMQTKKSIFMYGSTLLFAVSLFLQVEGRARLHENSKLFALFTAYVLFILALVFFSVYIAFLGRTGQKISPTIKEKHVSKGGLDRFTFRSYEWFNAMHFVLAAAEIAVSVYKIGVWGVLNIFAAVGSAVLSLLSRNVLYKANAGQLTYVPEKEDE